MADDLAIPRQGQLRALIHVRSGPWAWTDAVVVVLATCVPLLVVSSLEDAASGVIALCGGFAALYGLGEPVIRRARIVTSAGFGLVAVMSACTVVAHSRWEAAIVLALTAAVATFVIDMNDVGQPGMIMLLVTASVALGLPHHPDDLGKRALLTAAGAATALAISLAQLPVSRARRIRSAGNNASLPWRFASRLGTTTLATAAVVIGMRAPHWYWAPISAAAVQGVDVTMAIHRAVQRSAGTVLGVLVTALALQTRPGFAATVAMFSIFMGASQLCFRRNYALGITCITPMVFLLPWLAHHGQATSSMAQRLWVTTLGALIGVVAMYLSRDRGMLKFELTVTAK